MVGAQGNQGNQGFQGVIGAQGSQGSAAVAGSTAFGEMTISNNATAVILTNRNQYYNVGPFVAGDLNNFTYSSNTLTCLAASSYETIAAISFSSNTNGQKFSFGIFKNNQLITDHIAQTTTSSGETTNIVTVTVAGIVSNINVNDTFDLRVLNSTSNTTTVTVVYCNFSAFAVSGATGAQGVQGNTGAQGVQGATGSGAQGNQGFQGVVGAQGNQGNQGVVGAQGSTGSQGNQGVQGSTGSQGNQGVQGATGVVLTSGYLANSVSFANSTGYLSNTTNFQYFTSNNNLVLSGSLLTTSVNIGTTTIVGVTSNTYTTSSSSQVSVDAFDKTVYRSAKYHVQMTSGTSYHSIELLMIHDNTTANLSQYGEITTTVPLGTFDVSISSNVVNLLFTGVNNVTVIKLIRTAIVV